MSRTYDDSLQLAERIISYYIDCLEAEAAGSIKVPLGSASHIILENGSNPIFAPRNLPNDETINWWFGQYQNLENKTPIIVGWPLIVGKDNNNSVVSPLFTVEVSLSKRSNIWQIKPTYNSFQINDEALKLVGIDRHQTDYIFEQWKETEPFLERETSIKERIAKLFSFLDKYRIFKTFMWRQYMADNLSNFNIKRGIYHTALICKAPERSRYIFNLLEDLYNLLDNPEWLTRGPSAVMLGLAQAPPSLPPKTHPIVVPTTEAQNQAVTSAMTNVFTVVTGPPGTGKSQVLVNLVVTFAEVVDA